VEQGRAGVGVERAYARARQPPGRRRYLRHDRRDRQPDGFLSR